MPRRIAIAALLSCLLAGAAQAALWTKYVADDGSFSFHYPAGWKFSGADSAYEMSNPNTGEQLLIIAPPVQPGQDARAVAENMVKLLTDAAPGLQVDKWYQVDEKVAVLRISYTEKDVPSVAYVQVIRQGESAYWFSYSAPSKEFAVARAEALLQGLIGSVSPGADSKLPEVVAPPLATVKLQRNAEAFVFVLEFACGTAFGASQEKMIVDDVLTGWKELTPEEQGTYDGYFGVKQVILTLNQEKLAELRESLQKELAPLLTASEQSPAIKVIRDNLNQSHKLLVEGEPPLTVLAARSYAELVGYATLLQANQKAQPAEVPTAQVAQLQKDLTAAWPGFTKEEKDAVLSTPGVWMATREIVQEGGAEEKAQLRENLRSLAVATAKPAAAGAGTGGGAAGDRRPMGMVEHQTLMMMQQQTFNTYMWSRGYSGWTPTGKRW